MVQQSITGGAEQVAGKNINNRGPQQRLSNTIHIKMADKGEQLTITELQRKGIAAKVYEVQEKTSIKPLEIYANILKDFGIEAIRDLPRDKYKEVMASLEQSMNKLGEGASLAVAEDVRAGFCSRCTKIQPQLIQIWLVLGVVFVLIIAATITKILFFSADSRAQPESIHRLMHRCDFESRAYSIGSQLIMPNNRQCECIFDAESGIAHWVVSKATSD